jgi:hypothetical protein
MSGVSAVDPTTLCTHPHVDWSELAGHLVAAFPLASRGEVMGELLRAKGAGDLFGLDTAAQLRIAESICRYELVKRGDRSSSGARSDPQSLQQPRTAPNPDR